jgi:signal transduction histidine kinase
MRIRSQFVITMLLFGGMLVVIAVSAIIINGEAVSASRQEQQADQIAEGAGDLSYLSNDYLIYRESQQLRRWQDRYAAVAAQVAGLNVADPAGQALARNVAADVARMKEVFDSIQPAAGAAPASPPPSMAELQVAWSRMGIQCQELMTDATRLASLLRGQVDRLVAIRTWLTYLLIGVFGLYFLISYLATQTRVLAAIARLTAGAAVIGSGNLDYAIAVERHDEIGELSQAFNRMAADLKRVTASKGELEQEMAERRRAEEEVLTLNASLAQRAAELEASNKELEAFAYSVSHDLRAPLRGIDGFAQALLEDCAGGLDATGRQYLGLVRQNAQRMSRLIDDLLAFSRVGRQALRTSPVQLDGVVQRAWEELGPDRAGRLVELRVGDLPACQGDPALLKQVFINLLGNALKFSRARSPAIVEVGCQDGQGGGAVYYVKDNGIGFDMQYVDQVFGVFQRLHRAEEYEGTGVGLAIVQRVIQRHGGRIWAEAAVGQGAAFYFTLGADALR